MKWIALIMLFLVACTMPQPTVTVDDIDETIDTSLDVTKDTEETEDAKESSSIIVKKGDSEDVEKTEDQVESEDVVESSPVTGSFVTDAINKGAYIGTPPVKEKLSLSESSLMTWLVEIFAQDVESYEFYNDNGKISVRGDLFKISLNNPLRHLSDQEGANTPAQDVITTIYVDRNKKTATGYCEGFDTGLRRECESNDLLDIPRTLNFDEHNLKLPEDWLWELLEEEPQRVETDKYYVNSKKVIRALFVLEENELDIYFAEKTGLPVRISTKENGLPSQRDFMNLNANSVKETDVTHRDLSEIPSSDYFN